MTDSHNQDLVILKLDRALQALAEAQTIQQTKKIVDVARAAEIYATRQNLGEEAMEYAHSIKIEALRRLGELLKETPKNEGTRLAGRAIGGIAKELPKDCTPTLADLGIDKKTSMIAQQLAGLPLELFRQVEAGTVTITKALRVAQRAKGRNTNKPAWSRESVEQRLRKAINNEIDGAPPGSHRIITGLLRRLADELDEAADPELYDAVSIARDELNVRDAEPGGYKVFDGATVIASCKSTHQS